MDRAVRARSLSGPQPVAEERLACGFGKRHRWVVLEDPALEIEEYGGRIEPHFLRQLLPVAPERPERVGLASASIQRRHQLGPERLPQRVLVDQRLEPGDHIAVVAAREFGLDQAFLGNRAQFAQSLGLGQGPVLVGELGVGGPTPQAQRLADR